MESCNTWSFVPVVLSLGIMFASFLHVVQVTFDSLAMDLGSLQQSEPKRIQI